MRRINFNIEHSLFNILNSDFWPFDTPFGGPFGKLMVQSEVEGLMVQSSVEGLATLSNVEGP